jgi:hypothetical protein
MKPNIVAVGVDVVLQEEVVTSVGPLPEDAVQVAALEVGSELEGSGTVRGVAAFVEGD